MGVKEVRKTGVIGRVREKKLTNLRGWMMVQWITQERTGIR